jgi:outer membrane protein OmpA-like peptidoglycan-associated protein
MSASRPKRFLPAGLSCLGLAACATTTAIDTGIGAAPSRTLLPAHLVQQGFGGQAHFAYCLPPDCPRPTRKFHGAPIASVSVGQVVPPLSTTVHFAHAQSQLDAAAQRALEQARDTFAQASRITVTGYTDDTGPQPVNDRIALARARSVADFLQTRIPASASQIETQGRGRCCYLDTNQTLQGRARNRRVEVAIALSPAVTSSP